MRSSSVRTTLPVLAAPSGLITASSRSLRSASMATPRWPSLSQTSARTAAARSPMPPVNTSVSSPPSAAAYAPIWIGGRTARSLRRAVELAQAWAPFALSRQDLAVMLERARATDAWHARTSPLEVIVQATPPLDPLSAPEDTRARVERLREAGVTGLALRFVHHSPDHYCEQLAALAELVPAS